MTQTPDPQPHPDPTPEVIAQCMNPRECITCWQGQMLDALLQLDSARIAELNDPEWYVFLKRP